VSRWERGSASPSGVNLVGIARACGTTVEELVSDLESAPAPA